MRRDDWWCLFTITFSTPTPRSLLTIDRSLTPCALGRLNRNPHIWPSGPHSPFLNSGSSLMKIGGGVSLFLLFFFSSTVLSFASSTSSSSSGSSSTMNCTQSQPLFLSDSQIRWSTQTRTSSPNPTSNVTESRFSIVLTVTQSRRPGTPIAYPGFYLPLV